ncbi:hypothetical protein [Nocardioides sp.]|uniref:T3SS (YopN, CesT) and YbjN peptide-binding chaperone 1 n=1 Tax=Nocardioides sp. TaxID=35761 RepID=UPI00321AD6CA
MRDELDLDEATDAAWVGFRRRLADHLAVMAQGAELRLEVSAGVDDSSARVRPCLVVCALDAELVAVEWASDGAGAVWVHTQADVAAMAGLGWDETVTHDGVDHRCAAVEPRRADELAVLLVRTLREVYDVPHPSFLAAGGLEVDPAAAPARVDEGEEPEGPGEYVELEGVPTDGEHLQLMVDAALSEVFPDLRHDEDGDIPIVAGSSVAYVRVLPDRPCIELFAVIVIRPDDPDRVPGELVLLNDAHPLWKFSQRGDRIEMRHQLVALPFSAYGLRMMVRRFTGEVDDIARGLTVRVGGTLFREPELVEDERDVLMSGLLELLHLDRVRAATVAGLFDHDRVEIIRQLVRIRRGEQSCGDHDEEIVLEALRKALRYVADGEAPAHVVASEPAPPTVQGALLDDPGADDPLDLGWSA